MEIAIFAKCSKCGESLDIDRKVLDVSGAPASEVDITVEICVHRCESREDRE